MLQIDRDAQAAVYGSTTTPRMVFEGRSQVVPPATVVAFRDQLEDAGLVISGLSPDERLVEMVELPRDVHPWYVATQAHPEFKSRPTNPQPLFREFVRALIGQHEGVDRLQVTPMNLATD